MKVIQSGFLSPEKAMYQDKKLLQDLSDQSCLHLYQWERPSVTYGHFIDVEKWLKKEGRPPIAKRPTGGGLTFHQGDRAFSFLLPSCHPRYSKDPLLNYHLVNETLASCFFATFGIQLELKSKKEGEEIFCMTSFSPYDLCLDGKKVGGAAQRNKKQGFLHQGFIQLVPMDIPLVTSWLHKPKKISDEIKRYSGSVFPSLHSLNEKGLDDWEKNLIQAFANL